MHESSLLTSLKASNILPQEARILTDESEIKSALGSLTETPIYAGPALLQMLDWKDFMVMQLEGTVISLISQEFPFGTYAGNSFKDRSSHPDNSFFKLFRLGKGSIQFISRPFQKMDQQQLDSAPFQSIPTYAQAVALYSEGQWSDVELIPFSNYVISGINSTVQYGQSVFEGMVAQRHDQNTASVFRPLANAARFNRSLERLSIPALPEGLFLKAIELAVKANADYVPAVGSPARLYVRPYVMAVNGGDKVIPASQYIFTVQVFPFTSYAKSGKQALDVIAFEGEGRALPGIGCFKLSGNYAPTLIQIDQASKSLVPGTEQETFDGVLYSYTNSEGTFVEEYNAANVFFLKGKEAFTPTLESRRILPGITRESVIYLLRKKGYSVSEIDFPLEMVNQMEAGFLSGSAAGIVALGSVSRKTGERHKFQVPDIIRELQSDLSNLRNGIVTTDDPEIREWPHLIELGFS